MSVLAGERTTSQASRRSGAFWRRRPATRSGPNTDPRRRRRRLVWLVLGLLAFSSAVVAVRLVPASWRLWSPLSPLSPRPVLVAVVDPGGYDEATSASTAGGLVGARLGDMAAEAVVPPQPEGRELSLVIRGNLPRVYAPPPPIETFQALRLFEADLVDRRTGTKVHVPGMRVEVRVAARKVDLEFSDGDASRLLLLHYRSALGRWEDTHPRIEGDELVASVVDLSPFAVGVLSRPPASATSARGGATSPRSQAPATVEAAGSTASPPDAAEPATAADPIAAIVVQEPAAAPPSLQAATAVDQGVPPAPRRTATPDATTVPAARPAPPTASSARPPDGTGQAHPIVTPLDTDTGEPAPAPAPALAAAPTLAPPAGETKVSTWTAAASGPTPASTPALATTSTPTPAVTIVASVTPTLRTSPGQSVTPGAVATVAATAAPPVPPAATATTAAVPPAVFDISTPGSSSALLSRSNIVPGDTWSYNIVVRNSGHIRFDYTLTVTAPASSGLDDPASISQAPSEGLQLAVARCTPSFAACTTDIYDGPIRVSQQPIGMLAAGASDSLRLTVRLPQSTGDAFQGLTSVLDLTWTATQATQAYYDNEPLSL
ncbi:MAG: hypothetical protein HY332_07475 [Chloroflexi bacterium]|nr:hypothetical protein [Chloroflexota bacterium]